MPKFAIIIFNGLILLSLMKNFYFIPILVLMAGLSNLKAQLLAFPTAEGAGKYVTGGRGNALTAPKVFEVTTLTDDATSATTPGTFRYACTNNSPSAPNRIIVFRVSGTIHLYATLSMNRANTTIAGQTAPGEGICIADHAVYIGANNFIVRNMRFRLGDRYQNLGMVNGSGADDAFGDNGNGRTNLIIDHCSMSWSDDESFTVYSGDNITLQWNILEEPLNYSYHFETGDADFEQHAYGGIWGGKHASFHHNLIAHIKGRGPRFDGIRNIPADSGDFRNNVIYNWADYNTNGGEGGAYNVVNNYYKYGPNTPSTSTSGVNRRNMLINPYKQTSPSIPYGKYYLTGNYCDNSTVITDNNWKGAAMNGGSLNDTTSAKVLVPFNCIDINMETAQDAYNSVLAKAGCILPHRDTLDQRVVNDVKNRTGKLIDVQGDYPHGTPYALTVNAWPTLASGTVPTDTDHDGMTDRWESARGLNPSSSADLNGYISTSGYNNLENYLNGDTIVAAGITNTCITARQINSTNSGQWLHARDTGFSYYLSPVYTTSTDSNQIVASILDNGNYGTFDVSYYTTNTLRNDGAGHYYLNRNISITPQNPALITQPVTVRLYISKAELDALKAADPAINTIADLRIFKVSNNSCLTTLSTTPEGITQTASAVFGSYQNGYYIEFQTSSFSSFFFGSSSYPVPLKLVSFNATLENKKVNTKWVTENEVNTQSFTVEKSASGNNFYAVGNVAALSTSGTHHYSFVDADPLPGTSYYRLKMNDRGGIFTYSNIVAINNKTKTTLVITPNPVNEKLLLGFPKAAANAVIKIISADGSQVMKYNITAGLTQSQIITSSLPAGMYQVIFTDNNQVISTKFIKQ